MKRQEMERRLINMVRGLCDEYAGAIENDLDINGAEAVDSLVEFVANALPLISRLEVQS